MTQLKRRAVAILFATLTVLGIGLVGAPAASAGHSSGATCQIWTEPNPREQTVNLETGASIVEAGANVSCHEGWVVGDPNFSEQVTELYIHATLQIQRLDGRWVNRDTASARWTGLIGNTPPSVRANLADACVNSANRKHRVRFDDAWARMGDGDIRQITQGAYSGSQPYLTCGH